MAICKRSFTGLILLFLAFHLSLSFSFGQEKADPSGFGSRRPLSEVLNPDGTLKVGTGVRGSFDPTGLRMVSGPGGQPSFLPVGPGLQTEGAAIMAAAGDESWYPQFNQPWTILKGPVYAIAVDGPDVYVGGDFTWAGQNTNCRHIARWNTVTGLWEPLSGGLDGCVYAIAVSGTDVYAGGSFTGRIAAFHNEWGLWQTLGANGTVYALTVSGTDVYAGGYFTSPASYVAKWNGASWSALGSGVNGGVYALAVSGTDVYVGGNFTTAGGNPANYAAKWNGTTWSALGSGLNWHFLTVGGSALAVRGMDVYVGGVFTSAGVIPANYIAKWNGASWSALGSGLNNMVSALALSGREVYVGGQFTYAGGKQSFYFARWVEPLAVDSPNGGESWEAGTSHAITWTAEVSVGPLKIEYSANNGSTWTTVAASKPNTGSWSWTVPNTPSASCRVRISAAADGDPVDASDGSFTIAGFQVTSPTGVDKWTVGTPRTITWNTVGSFMTVRLELSTDNGATWGTITESTANTGSYV